MFLKLSHGAGLLFGVVLMCLVFASSVRAAGPEFSIEVEHEPSTINRGDEYVGYAVRVKNTGTSASVGTLSVQISLPEGIKFLEGAGAGWSCHPVARTCTSEAAVAGGAEWAPLKIETSPGPEAPDTVEATLIAFGAGAGSDAVASDSYGFGPATPFGLTALSAGACSAPPPAQTEIRSCPAAEAKGATPYTTAGGHPFAASSALAFATRLGTDGGSIPVQSLRDLFTELPPGFTGNPEAVPGICTVADVRESTSSANLCPDSSAVGGISLLFPHIVGEGVKAPIYWVVPEEGFVAALAFKPVEVGNVVVVIRARVRSNGDYGVSAVAPQPPQVPELVASPFVTLCGYGAKTKTSGVFAPAFVECKQPGINGANAIPFLTNPTRCAGGEPVTSAIADSYQRPGAQDAEERPVLSDPAWKLRSATSPTPTGCEALTEAWVGEGPDPTPPSLSFTPDSTQAAAPAAYSAHLHIPQPGLTSILGRATAHLKDTTVTLPAGLALNPSAAAGLGACSEAQAGYLGNEFPAPNPVHFSTVSAGCPPDSKLGTVEAITPLLDKPLKGAVYLAAQRENPFGSDFALYLVIEDRETGIKATLAGKVSPSESEEGRITSTFQNNPQVPVEDLSVDFFKGPNASLVNSDVCGSYTTHTELTPWSAADPDHPLPGEIAHSQSTVAIDGAPEGQGSCPASKAARPFDLQFSAGVADPSAGAHSPFSLRIARPQGDQEISKVTVATPPGFAASLKGVSLCSQAAIDQAKARKNSGEGALELAHPSCPASSQIGTTTIGAGTGKTDGTQPSAFYVKTGKAYLTGPYKGAPLSLTFVVPAVAGPFDLGVQVVRTALRVNPKTAQITAESDPIPQMLDGVPLDIRDIRVAIDRPGFTLNPTSCEPMAIAAQVAGSSGASRQPLPPLPGRQLRGA